MEVYQGCLKTEEFGQKVSSYRRFWNKHHIKSCLYYQMSVITVFDA